MAHAFWVFLCWLNVFILFCVGWVAWRVPDYQWEIGPGGIARVCGAVAWVSFMLAIFTKEKAQQRSANRDDEDDADFEQHYRESLEGEDPLEWEPKR